MIQKKGVAMVAKNSKMLPPRPMRWHESDWAWLAEVAKSVGVSRSEFVRRAALLAAKATEAGLTSYSVSGTPQNTRTNHFDHSIAQQGSGRSGGGGSRSRSKPEAFSGPITEELERKGGGFSTNEADQLAIRQIGPRS